MSTVVKMVKGTLVEFHFYGCQIGNWSRWLTDLFGIDEDDSVGDENDQDDSEERQDTSLKSFHLLNALSDLMMLPKDMLLSRPIREEVWYPNFRLFV